MAHAPMRGPKRTAQKYTQPHFLPRALKNYVQDTKRLADEGEPHAISNGIAFLELAISELRQLEKEYKARPPQHNTCDFLSALPDFKFTTAELELREAILSAMLSDSLRIYAPEPPVSVVAQDYKVRLALMNLQHEQQQPDLDFIDWIEARVGGELMVLNRDDGELVLRPTEAAVDALDDLGAHISHQGQHSRPIGSPIGSPIGKGYGKDTSRRRSRERGREGDAGYARGKGSGTEMQGKGSGKESARRKGSAKEAAPSRQGKGFGKEPSRGLTQEQRQEDIQMFFAGLPDAHLTIEEENLRMALLDFLASWNESDPPSLKAAGEGSEAVRRGKKELLPKALSVAWWIEQRVGGEIETVVGPGSLRYYGLHGQDSERLAAIATDVDESGPRKRARYD